MFIYHCHQITQSSISKNTRVLSYELFLCSKTDMFEQPRPMRQKSSVQIEFFWFNFDRIPSPEIRSDWWTWKHKRCVTQME